MRILVVDDSIDSRLLIKTILEAEGYPDLVLAGSAREALGILGLGEIPPAQPPVDLVVLDLVMPEMDGIEACRRITASPAHQDVPVIVVTADDAVQSLQAAFAVGAVDYLTKPLDPVELVARLRSVLRLKQEMDRRRARERELLDVTRLLEAANEELRRLSSMDGLTGIANRRRFDEFLDHEWRRLAREKTPLAVVLLDIDCFKPFNDRYGHVAGDDCLRRVADAVRQALRRPGDLVARYGGEELAGLLPGTDEQGATAVAEAMRERVAALGIEHRASEAGERVTVSVGVAVAVPDGALAPATLVHAADQALYRAKREGRNRVRVGKLSPP